MIITSRPNVWPKHYGPRASKTAYTSKPKGGKR